MATPLENTLHSRFDEGWYNLINDDTEEFNSLLLKKDERGASSKDFTFAAQGARPVANAQLTKIDGRDRAFIQGKNSTITNHTAKAKKIQVVCEFDEDDWKRAEKDPEHAFENAMDLEVYNQAVNSKEIILRDYASDGTGALSTVTGAGTIASGEVTFTTYMNKDFATYPGWIFLMQEGMEIIFADSDGTERVPTVSAGTYSRYSVEEVDYEAKTFLAQAQDSDGTKLTVTATNVVDEDHVYPFSDKGQFGIIDRTSITDYGLEGHMPGLQSLGAADGRVTNGVTLSGVYAGTQVDVTDGGSNPALFHTMFNKALAKANRRVGRDKFDYPAMKCSFDTWNHVINLDEGNKIIKPTMNERGAVSYHYIRGKQQIELVEGRFCPDYEIWFEPKLKQPRGSKNVKTDKEPLKFLYSGYEFKKEPGSDKTWRYKVVGGVRVETIESHLQTYGTFVCGQSAALIRLTGFSINN